MGDDTASGARRLPRPFAVTHYSRPTPDHRFSLDSKAPHQPLKHPMAQQFIYVMKALTKVVPPSRVILNDIWLSFYPGAKIGVLGANGAGKSSLLRIMAGIDHDYNGEAWAAQGTKIGFLPQEPQLDSTLDVRGNVELAVKSDRAILDRFNQIMMEFAEPMSDDKMEKLLG